MKKYIGKMKQMNSELVELKNKWERKNPNRNEAIRC